MQKTLKIGIDAGSTTLKVVMTDEDGGLIYKDYRRHYADISGVLTESLGRLQQETGDWPASLVITGSAGMGIAERFGLPFIQEVVASGHVISQKFPEVNTLVDIGGEDAKMIFFSQGKSPDIRMNGSCAGGTGAFIDQMATLLGTDASGLGQLAEHSGLTYPIASRCGVFSKTDIQNLLSRNVCKEDIAASIFHAVSLQIITSLARGHEVDPEVFLCGGPFAFLPALRKAFSLAAGLTGDQLRLSVHAAVIAAWGASLSAEAAPGALKLSAYRTLFGDLSQVPVSEKSQRLMPLFASEHEKTQWLLKKSRYTFPSVDFQHLESTGCFLGIDSGSTTTKIVAIDGKERVFFRFYEKNQGDSLLTVRKGLAELSRQATLHHHDLVIAGSCVTGYGEDLIRKAFNLDYGMVETMAHYTAATVFDPEVSFILDIGGQDMKAVFVENGVITRLEINEACSSGCGSFVDTFAQSLRHTVADFALMACSSKKPCDLGTRCTVFMNSRVKQFLREGAEIEDISAGLSYSVIRNCLQKVLKVKDVSVLGKHLMVQGGAFRNPSLVRALEIECGLPVMSTDGPELMGAYGAALHARRKSVQDGEKATLLRVLLPDRVSSGKIILCRGCENQCAVTRFSFGNDQHYFSGNKCEKIFCNGGAEDHRAVNLYEEKARLLFDRACLRNKGGLKLGIPRVLGLFENYPFWHRLLTGCGINVVLSDPSTMKMYESGIGTVMSDNICFPAKLANGHVLNLIEKKVDRIFLPFVVFENNEDEITPNSYNCPIVTGYSEVLKSAINPLKRYGIPIDAPSFTFKDKVLMKKACRAYIRSLPGVSSLKKAEFDGIFEQALLEQRRYEETLTRRCREVLESAVKNGRMIILLAGRPYHTDPLIQHKIAGVIADFGVDVITEDMVRPIRTEDLEVQSVMQWAYTNRILKAAKWVAESGENVHFVELTSFGCGPDAFILDEISNLLKRHGKNPTLLKIDDINNMGSMRLRLRSLIDSLKHQQRAGVTEKQPAVPFPAFMKEDRRRKILMPWFGDFYSPFLPALFGLMGYEAVNLPPSNQESAEYGLKYSNNEICYPATLIVGDFMKAMLSGQYKSSEVALAITQTGGQCRATNYISLVKRAMMAAGFTDVPVISIAAGSGIYNTQPGFELKWTRIFREVIYCLVFADCLSQMVYASKPREIEPGRVEELRKKYLALGIRAIEEKDPRGFLNLASMAAGEFRNAIECKTVPQIGIVGEIFVKYNSFGNRNVVNWLVNQGIEPLLPPITSFFLEGLASTEARIDGLVERRSRPKFLKTIVERYVFRIIRKMEARLSDFPYYRPIGNPHEDAGHAAEIINLNAQFGEGWLIPAEFSRFARDQVNNVVSLQPFGCIANHIISKGIEKRTRELFPDMNLLFLDFDSGMSDANIFNRLHFVARNAFEQSSKT